ncbi:hypothetical protein [Desulfonatronum thioautotrophicum]|uniref:hypothetical protein n=1 Tax=Desulfonatronum thioautotrophicum TaxID=617001 RepID=UPI00069C0409|nr:hypothetical protein [Desulfonatronum thioautotrophicum]
MNQRVCHTSAQLLPFLLAFCLTFWVFASHGQAADSENLPEDVALALGTLIDRAQDKDSVTIQNLRPLLDFAQKTAPLRDDWEVPTLHNATGAYYGYTIATPVERIVEHIYHPELPPSLFHPSVVRVGKWFEQPEENIPQLWEKLEEGHVKVIRWEELEENTPDVNTGGYYTYQTDRMIILAAHEGKKYLLSVSKQQEESSVGRKGVVIGDDQDWNYFYTDEEGLTTGGLGWVNSYMFDSFSVTMLSADPAAPEHSRHAMFKWVRAGWSGMNMVRPSHVRNGCKRFAQSLVWLMESDKLPELNTLVAMSARVLAMDEQEALNTLQPYIENLRDLSSADSVLSRRSFQRILNQDNPLEHYSLYAKQSLVMKEFLKASVGLPALLAVYLDDVLVSFLH